MTETEEKNQNQSVQARKRIGFGSSHWCADFQHSDQSDTGSTHHRVAGNPPMAFVIVLQIRNLLTMHRPDHWSAER